MSPLRPLSLAALVLLGCPLAIGSTDEAKDEEADAGVEIPEFKLSAEVRKALAEGKSFTVMSIDPVPTAAVPTRAWRVLKRKTIEDPALRKEVVTAVIKAADDARGALGCFEPRHAIFTELDGHRYELVICFHCLQLSLYRDGQSLPGSGITRSAQDLLDKVLK
ncbi:MAG TPA: hypothetical protein VMF30_14045 [Pirellulales bacterium]|nr:hypothetical protein [Pirellulales bacterium]